MKDSQPIPGLGAIPVAGRLFCYLGAKALGRGNSVQALVGQRQHIVFYR